LPEDFSRKAALEFFMATLAIIWRNPNHVQNRLRCSQQRQAGDRATYIVQQLLSGERNIWVNTSIFEVICGRQTVPTDRPVARGWRFGLGW
jgi:hypothetical protein